MGAITFDDFLIHVGDFGRFQKLTLFLCLILMIVSAFITDSSLFILTVPEHRCAVPGLPNDTFDIQHDFHLKLVNASIPWDEETGNWDSCHVRRQNADAVFLMENSTLGLSNSSMDQDIMVQCNEWVYNKKYFDLSLIEELDLVCDRVTYRTHGNMALMLGKVVSSVIFGRVADMVGRKLALMILTVMLIFSLFANALLMYNIPAMLVLRFLNGGCATGIYYTSYILSLECTSPENRNFLNILYSLFFVGAGFFVTLDAWAARNYIYIGLSVAVPSVFYLSFYWLLCESPRWLLTKGRVEEAKKILKNVAKSNGKAFPEELFYKMVNKGRPEISIDVSSDEIASFSDDAGDLNKEKDVEYHNGIVQNKGRFVETRNLQKEKHSVDPVKIADGFLQLFHYRTLVIRLFVVLVEWFIVGAVYYAVMFNLSNVSGSVYLNFTLLCCVDFVVNFGVYFVLDRFGRKKTYIGLMLISVTGCFASILPGFLMSGDEMSTISTIISLVGRGGVSAAFNVIILYSAELFPTSMRSMTIGASCMSSKIGSALAPYIADLGIIIGGPLASILPLIVCGIAGVVGIILVLVLPETVQKHLPNTIEDALQIGRRRTRSSTESTEESEAMHKI